MATTALVGLGAIAAVTTVQLGGGSSNEAAPGTGATSTSDGAVGTTEPASFQLELVVSRGGNLECYSFHSDGTVELRHGGLPAVNDVGTVSGDDTGGEIFWDSGRQSSYEWDGKYYVDGAEGAIIDSCLG